MKVGILAGSNGTTTALWNAENLIVVDGREEVISLAYGRISNFIDLDILIGKNFLDGEINFLGQVYGIIIDGSSIARKTTVEDFDAELTLGNVAISSAKLFDDFIMFFFPFPIRDCSINNSIVYEILDYDVMRELYRITKPGGRVRIIIRDKLHGGLRVDDIMKFMIKFDLEKISWENGFWVIDLIKKKRR